MRLPPSHRAIVEPAKVRDYLLAPEHPVGRFKAEFFARMGYSSNDWEGLAEDLRRMIETEEAVIGQRSPFGQKLEVRGTVIARFVTAIPG